MDIERENSLKKKGTNERECDIIKIFSESLVNIPVNSPAFETLTPLTEAPSHQSFQQLPEIQQTLSQNTVTNSSPYSSLTTVTKDQSCRT